MVGFRDRWRWIIDALKKHASAIGVDPDAIVVGNWQQGQHTAVSMPGLIVYLVPGDLFTDTPRDGTATFMVFVLADSSDSIEDAAGAAVDMAWRVKRAIAEEGNGIVIRWPKKGTVEIDTVTQTLSAARLNGVIEYDVR